MMLDSLKGDGQLSDLSTSDSLSGPCTLVLASMTLRGARLGSMFLPTFRHHQGRHLDIYVPNLLLTL